MQVEGPEGIEDYVDGITWVVSVLSNTPLECEMLREDGDDVVNHCLTTRSISIQEEVAGTPTGPVPTLGILLCRGIDNPYDVELATDDACEGGTVLFLDEALRPYRDASGTLSVDADHTVHVDAVLEGSAEDPPIHLVATIAIVPAGDR